MQLTEDAIRAEALTTFADLTRHKESPHLLADKFSCAMLGPDLVLGFGKRRASVEIDSAMLELTIEQFRERILVPLAHRLLASA